MRLASIYRVLLAVKRGQPHGAINEVNVIQIRRNADQSGLLTSHSRKERVDCSAIAALRQCKKVTRRAEHPTPLSHPRSLANPRTPDPARHYTVTEPGDEESLDMF